VRYVLGLRDFASGHFELRILYNFRHRLNAQMRTDSSRQPGRQPRVIAGVCTDCLNGFEPRRADLSSSLISGQGRSNPSAPPGPPARNAMAAT